MATQMARAQKAQIGKWMRELNNLNEFVTKGKAIGDDPNAPEYKHARMRIFQLEQAVK